MSTDIEQELRICSTIAPLVDALLHHIERSSLAKEHHYWLKQQAHRSDQSMLRLLSLSEAEGGLLLLAAPMPHQFVLAIRGDEFRVSVSIIEGTQGAQHQMRISELAGSPAPLPAMVNQLVSSFGGTIGNAFAGYARLGLA